MNLTPEIAIYTKLAGGLTAERVIDDPCLDIGVGARCLLLRQPRVREGGRERGDKWKGREGEAESNTRASYDQLLALMLTLV